LDSLDIGNNLEVIRLSIFLLFTVNIFSGLEEQINFFVSCLVFLNVNYLLDGFFHIELLKILSEIATFHLTIIKKILHIVKHELGRGFGYLTRLPHLFKDANHLLFATSEV